LTFSQLGFVKIVLVFKRDSRMLRAS